MQWQLQATETLLPKRHPISGKCLFFSAWDSKYLVSIQPRRHCDHRWHNGFPDEERAQLLSLNKISQFPLHTAQWLSPGCWLSSYSPGAIIAAGATPPRYPQPLPPDFIRALRAKGRGFIIAEIFHSLHVFLFACHDPPIIVLLCFFPPSFISPHIAWQLASLAVIDQIDKWIF